MWSMGTFSPVSCPVAPTNKNRFLGRAHEFCPHAHLHRLELQMMGGNGATLSEIFQCCPGAVPV